MEDNHDEMHEEIRKRMDALAEQDRELQQLEKKLDKARDEYLEVQKGVLSGYDEITNVPVMDAFYEHLHQSFENIKRTDVDVQEQFDEQLEEIKTARRKLNNEISDCEENYYKQGGNR